MSAPLVVNTTDGTVWMRQTPTRDGAALYAMKGAPDGCPEYLMETLAELEKHGIAGEAYALPVPARRPSVLAEVRGRKAYGDRLRSENQALTLELHEARKELSQIKRWVSENTPYDGRRPGQVVRTLVCLNELRENAESSVREDAETLRRLRDRLRKSQSEVERLREQVAETEVLLASAEQHTRKAVADDFAAFGKRRDELSWAEARMIAFEGLCTCRGGTKPCELERQS